MGAGEEMKIRICVNGSERECPQFASIADLCQAIDLSGNCYAIALNMVFVPRGRYEEIRLQEGDCLDILTPMQGG